MGFVRAGLCLPGVSGRQAKLLSCKGAGANHKWLGANKSLAGAPGRLTSTNLNDKDSSCPR
jgi:hypothetical protein